MPAKMQTRNKEKCTKRNNLNGLSQSPYRCETKRPGTGSN